MPQTPDSPAARRLAAPRWLDTRLVLGVLLVLVSVLVGARVLAGADRSQLVWAANRDLAPGSLLSAGDLVAVQVRLFDTAALYLDASEPAPVGYAIGRGLGRGELLPDDALLRPGVDVDLRLVTVLVEFGHLPPDLTDAQHVDVWVTPDRDRAAPAPVARVSQPAAKPPGGAVSAPPELAQLVLSGVTVAIGPPQAGFAAAAAAVPVVLAVRPGDVAAVLAAMSLGRIDLVRVPRVAEAAAPVAQPAGPG